MTIPYESLQDELVPYLYRHTHNWEDAKDLAQETILRLIELGSHPNPIAWCKTTGKNLAIDEGRTKKRRSRRVPYENAEAFQDVTVVTGADNYYGADPGDALSLQKNAVLKFINFVLEGHPAKREHLQGLVNHVLQDGSPFDPTQRNNKQLIKKVLHESLSRREFFSVAATLFAASDGVLREWAGIGAAPPRTILRVEELAGVLRFTSALRFHEGDIFTCRRILDPLLANQLQCWRKGPQTADAAAALMHLLDQRVTLALDSYSPELFNSDLRMMNTLLRYLTGANRAAWARRVMWNEARCLFHTDNLEAAVGVTKRIVGLEGPHAFFRRTKLEPRAKDDVNPTTLIFEVGTFLSGIGDKACHNWWLESRQQYSDAGDNIGPNRVEARRLSGEAEEHPEDGGRARENAEHLNALLQTLPELQSNPLLRIQHQLGTLKCLLIAKKESEATALLDELAGKDELGGSIQRVGYRLGAARLERACKLGIGKFQPVVLSRAHAVLRACRVLT